MFCKYSNQKSRALISAVVVVLGLISIVFGILMARSLPESEHNLVRLAGMFSGFGAGLLLAMAALTLYRKLISPARRKELEIAQNDERNVQIARAACSVCAVAGMLLFAVMGFVCLALGSSTASVLCIVCLYLQTIVLLVARAYYARKM